MVRSNFKEGDIVWIKVIPGTAAAKCIIDPGNPESWVFEGKVTFTGRKYIEINDRLSFDMSQNFKQHSLVDGEEYELYLSKSEAIESIEKRILFKRLQEICFKKEDRDFSLTQLREAVKLLTA